MKHATSNKKRSAFAKRRKTSQAGSRRSKRIESLNVVKNRANMLHGSILSHILSFSHVQDIPKIAATCSTWKAATEDAYETICQATVIRFYPRLRQLKSMEEDCLAGGSGTGAFSISTYKQILNRRLDAQYQPIGLNQELQMDFHTMFAHRGIVAFSNCCRECPESYYGDDETFHFRGDGGIVCIEAYLNGANFNPGLLNGVGVVYGCLRYINANWEEECKLMNLWCQIIGLDRDEYTFRKPQSPQHAIEIDLEEGVFVDLQEPLESMFVAPSLVCSIM